MSPEVPGKFHLCRAPSDPLAVGQNDNTVSALFFASMIRVCYGSKVSKISHHLRG